MSDHSTHSASIYDRYSRCPGSIGLSKNMPNTSSPEAKEGTAAHELGALGLIENSYAYKHVGRVLSGVTVTEEMAENVQVYLDYCWGLKELHQDAKCLVERRVDLSGFYDKVNLFGTCDFMLYSKKAKKLYVVDYKHGRGVPVMAVKEDGKINGQLLYYALGAMYNFDLQLDSIEVTIVQPRADVAGGPIRSATVTPLELVEWSGDLVDAVEATLSPNALLVPGDHCQFCPAKPKCPALAQKSLALAQQAFSDLDAPTIALPRIEELSVPEMLQVLEGADLFEGWLNAIRTHLHHLATTGIELTGWKLVPRRAIRRYRNEDQDVLAEELAKSIPSLASVDIWEHKIHSPAQLEARMAKADRPLLQAFVEKKSSGTTLVRDSDTRAPVSPETLSPFTDLTDISGFSQN